MKYYYFIYYLYTTTISVHGAVLNIYLSNKEFQIDFTFL